MTDHAGWLDSGKGVAPEELAARIAGPSRDSPRESVLLGPGAALTGSARAQLAHDPVRGVAALLSGHPRWLDPALAAIGRRQGDGQALLDAYFTHGERFVERLAGIFARSRDRCA